MPSAVTSFADMIIPESFSDYMVEQTAAQSALFQSGIIAPDDAISEAIQGKGLLAQMPFWKDLSGTSQVSPADGTTAVTTEKYESGQDQALVIARTGSWSANTFAGMLAGSDPAMALADRLASYWAREYQRLLLEILKGAFAAASMSGKIHDISALSGDSAKISGSAFVDAMTVMGDAADRITAVAVHSAVHGALLKQGLIEFRAEYEGAPSLPYYMGKRMIVDDMLAPASGGIYTSYLFGAGAVGWAERSHDKPLEIDRDAPKDNDAIFSRKIFVLHPRGVKWKGEAAAMTTDAALATGTNWERVYEPKNVRIVKFVHKI